MLGNGWFFFCPFILPSRLRSRPIVKWMCNALMPLPISKSQSYISTNWIFSTLHISKRFRIQFAHWPMRFVISNLVTMQFRLFIAVETADHYREKFKWPQKIGGPELCSIFFHLPAFQLKIWRVVFFVVVRTLKYLEDIQLMEHIVWNSFAFGWGGKRSKEF